MKKTVKLGTLCEVSSGISLSRVKVQGGVEDGSESTSFSAGRKVVKVLLPKALSKGVINADELVEEEVENVKPGYLTQAGDVVVKLTTPFDCAYVTEDLEGLLLTSSACALRIKEGSELDMRFLSAYLNSDSVSKYLASLSSGTTGLKTLRKKTLEDLDIPLVPLEKQHGLSKLFELLTLRKSEYLELMELDHQLFEGELHRTIEKD